MNTATLTLRQRLAKEFKNCHLTVVENGYHLGVIHNAEPYSKVVPFTFPEEDVDRIFNLFVNHYNPDKQAVAKKLTEEKNGTQDEAQPDSERSSDTKVPKKSRAKQKSKSK